MRAEFDALIYSSFSESARSSGGAPVNNAFAIPTPVPAVVTDETDLALSTILLAVGFLGGVY